MIRKSGNRFSEKIMLKQRGCRKIMAENQPARVRPKTKAKNKNAAFPKEGGVLFDHDT